jgi:hypothetical protein
MVEDGGIVTRQISRRLVERVAEGERADADYAHKTVKYRAERSLRRSSSYR